MPEYDNPYQRLVATGAKIDHHESDLYVEVTNLTRPIVQASKWSYSTFTSQADGKLWFELPFAYEPWWKTKR